MSVSGLTTKSLLYGSTLKALRLSKETSVKRYQRPEFWTDPEYRQILRLSANPSSLGKSFVSRKILCLSANPLSLGHVVC